MKGGILLISDCVIRGLSVPCAGMFSRIRVGYRLLILLYDRSLQITNKTLPAPLAYVNLITENFKSRHFNLFWTTKCRVVYGRAVLNRTPGFVDD
jgi:hypothetical protein